MKPLLIINIDLDKNKVSYANEEEAKAIVF